MSKFQYNHSKKLKMPEAMYRLVLKEFRSTEEQFPEQVQYLVTGYKANKQVKDWRVAFTFYMFRVSGLSFDMFYDAGLNDDNIKAAFLTMIDAEA